jgi:hypothetical protein
LEELAKQIQLLLHLLLDFAYVLVLLKQVEQRLDKKMMPLNLLQDHLLHFHYYYYCFLLLVVLVEV